MKEPAPAPPDVLTQVGALPLMTAADGTRRVLLATSRETKRWVIPKGWPVKGASP